MYIRPQPYMTEQAPITEQELVSEYLALPALPVFHMIYITNIRPFRHTLCAYQLFHEKDPIEFAHVKHNELLFHDKKQVVPMVLCDGFGKTYRTAPELWNTMAHIYEKNTLRQMNGKSVIFPINILIDETLYNRCSWLSSVYEHLTRD